MSKSFGKRLLAIVLSVLMVMTLMPTGMFAADSVEVTADNYQELLSVPLSVNSYMQDHVSWSWNGCGWNSTTLGGTVSVDGDWFGETYDSILTSDNTSEWTVNPSFCLSITDGGYLTESDKEVGYTGEEHTYNFTYSDIVIAATGYNDVTVSGATVETVFQFIQYSGYTGGTSYDIDLLTPIMEQTGLTLQQVAEEYIPAIYNVKFSATLNSFDGVSYSDIQAYLDEGDSGETTATVLATQTDSGTLTILSGADFTDEDLYLYINFEYTGDLDSDYIYYEPGYLYSYDWGAGIVPVSSYSSCGGTFVISLVDLAAAFEAAGYSASDGVILNYWGQDYSSFTSAQLVSTASDAGDSGDTGVTYDSGEYDLSDYKLSYSSDIALSSSNWNSYSFSDTAIVDAMATEGAILVVTRSTVPNEVSYDKFGFVDAYWSMGNWVALGTATSKTTDTESPVDIDCVFDNGTTVVYDANTIYNALVAAGFYGEDCGPAQFISNSGSETYTITNVSVYIPSSTVTLPWVDEAVAENTLTISGATWWYGIIYCTEAATNEAGSYDAGVSSDLDGFLAAIAEDDAVIEITSTGSGVDQIFLQKASDYSGTDSLSMTVTDNGDGTYTSTLSGAELSAYAEAVVEDGDSVWKVLVNKTTDTDTVITSVQVVEGAVVEEPEDTEFDLSSYTLWYSEDLSLTSSNWSTYEFTDTSWVDALTADGAIFVITRDTDTVTFSSSDVWDKFFVYDSSWANQISLGTKTSTDCTVNKTFDNGSMIVYSGASVYNALTSAGVDPAILVCNSTADTYHVTNISVYIPTATIIAANQETIDNLTALLLSYDDVVYINQSVAEDFNGYFSAGWSEVCASSWDWDEIASIWTTSLGEEATVSIGYTDYVAPVAGTTDDLDGTDGSITLTYYSFVGDSEAGTYIASQTYTVTIVIKASQLYHVDIPEDTEGRFTVTRSAEYAYEGDEVTITIETASGYKVSTFNVWYQDENGNICQLGTAYDQDNGVWIITMPAYDIWMDVTVGTLDVNYVYDSDAVFGVDGVTSANEGEEVTFYVFVNRGYELDGEITAVDENGNTVTLTEVYSGLAIMNYKPSTAYAYSFTMPDSSVTITANFKAIDGFIDGAFYITDYGEISFIDQVDFTDSDTYLVISYDLMFESDENVDNYGDWSPGAVYAVTDNGEWIQLFSIPSYYSTGGTYAISLTDIAALASDAGCNIDTYGVIINWWVNDNEYASNETFTLSSDYHEIVLMDSDGQVNISSSAYKQGDTATFTLDSLVDAPVISVTAVDSSGNSVEVTATDASNLEYTLTMPDSTVWITVTFATSYTSIVYQYGQCWDLSEGLFNSALVDLDDENLYLRVEYVMTGNTDSYGEIQYSTDFESAVHLTKVPVNENGITFISLKALSEAASELGYDGYYLFGVDLGSFDVDQSLVSIVTIGEYKTETSKVGEVITIGNQDYEVVWDTTEVNPDGVAYGYHNILGWSAYGMHSNWWFTFESFKSSLLNHLDDSSLIYIEGNEQTGKWLVVYNPDTYTSYEIPVGTYYDTDGTSVYMSIDEIVSQATEDGWDIETYFSAISNDAQENTVISAVRILTPLTYEVESVMWATDYSSVAIKLVAGSHTVYAGATDVVSAITEATCTTDGQVVYTATVAYNGQVFEVSTTATIPATGHTEAEAVEENRVEATCTTDGSYDSVVYCSDCGEELSRETITIPATGHTEAEAVVENRVEATCTEDGSYDSVVYCSVCGEELSRETITIPATGHTEAEAVVENRVEATCTEDGSYDSVVYCSVCGEELSRETVTIPATGHEYVAVVTDPTCTEGGYTTYTCSICGDSYTADETEATGHNYGEPVWTWDGYTSATATFTCGNDSTHVEVVTAEITSVTTAATCEADGETVYTATVTFNGETYTTTTTEVLSATGHDWTVSYEWSEDGKTCTATRSCANDSTHNVSETVTTVGTVTVQPTCTEKGTTTYTATFTSDWAETKTMDVVDVEALGHEWTVEYTWSEDGKSCTATHICGRDSTHNESETVTTVGTETVAPTCTEKGTTTYTATFTSTWAETKTMDVVDIDALGHTYGEPEFTWNTETCKATATFNCTVDGCDGSYTTDADVTSATTDATCTVDGKIVYTAVVTFNNTEYTDTYEVTIPATGHSTEIQGAKDATCTSDGYTGDEVCTICGETVTYGETIPAAHTFGDDGVCTVCGAKKDDSTETAEPTVTVESGDVIFAEVLPSGLVTEVEIKLSVDSGTVVVSTVTEDDSNPHLVEHISDTLGFTLFNEAQGDDLVKDTNSFTITDGNSTTPKKVTILFYGDIDYDGNSAPVTMTFASTTVLSKSDIYVLHYTGVGTVWEVVSSTSKASGKTLTVDFDATSFSPYVVVSVANVSSTSGGTTVLDVLLKVSADYSAVNEAIAKASALDPADYVDFTAVTEAINAVDWSLTAINQQAVTAYADAINAAIDALVKVTSITEEDVNIDEPVEDSTTETEDEEVTTPIATPVDPDESNPTTGLALSLLPMAIAALAAVSSKRRYSQK
ncbi:MAG: hypothetical protein LUF29_06275 [Oscillospiraceae bacterium]|nr:hypothetical protein [Oscillospiraceae bacterium]